MQKKLAGNMETKLIQVGKTHPKLKYICLVLVTALLGVSILKKIFLGYAKKVISVAVIVLFFFTCTSFDFVNKSENELIDVTEYIEDSVIFLEPSSNLAFSDTTLELIADEDETEIAQSAKSEERDYSNSGEVVETFTVDELIEALGNHATTEISEPSAVNEGEITTEIEGQTFALDSWNLLLVNKQHPIPDDYKVPLGTISGAMQCDERVIPELLAMLQDAKEDSVNLMLCSPYRNEDRQVMLFERKIKNYMNKGYSYLEAYSLSSQAVTLPGSSEHQIGLAFDIISPDHTSLDEAFENTAAGKWLANHCAEYGFILRYPRGKEFITGIEYEPWHFRYVGKQAAQIIMNNNLTLEEFTDLY